MVLQNMTLQIKIKS